ncbi:MAG: hypothetical protein ABSC55_11720 [Syntrophorhabdales bacterium]|jgi:hypothetical protein
MSTNDKDQRVSTAFEKLNEATQCVDKERNFLNELMHTEKAGGVANRIVLLMQLFQQGGLCIVAYLKSRAEQLFPGNPQEMTMAISLIISDIVREARLCAYLCIKGVLPQAVTVLRRPIELVGILTHIWHEPKKVKCLTQTDSADSQAYRDAFVSAPDKNLGRELSAKGIKYRFMHCSLGPMVSEMYNLLSDQFTHATTFETMVVRAAPRDINRSCFFIDRQSPEKYSSQYALAQGILGLLIMEMYSMVPKDDCWHEDLAPFTATMGLFGPYLTNPEESLPPDITRAVDQLLEAIEKAIPKKE